MLTTTGSDAGSAGGSGAAAQRAARRAGRVGAGFAELDQWLQDQVRGGLAGADGRGYEHWDRMASRLVDAQAPPVAAAVRRLAGVVHAPGWPGRLLAELALLRLLAVAHARIEALPEAVAATVRARAGYTVLRETVLATPPIPDSWRVLALPEVVDERITTRRVWLVGAATRRCALVLSFAPNGGGLDDSLTPGQALDADLHFYPGEPALRAAVGTIRQPVAPPALAAVALDEALSGWAGALAADPWLTAWPVLLADAVPVPAEDGWRVVCADRALPLLDDGADRWSVLAVSGGRPVPLFGEVTPDGFRPLAVVDAHD